jgi:aquaporin Z
MTAAAALSDGPAAETGRAADLRPACLIVHGLSEAVGTFAVMAGVQTVVALLIAPSMDPGLVRTLAVAALTAAAIAAVVLSPVGKLSGAHLNPAVSLAFFIEGRLTGREFSVYATMQVLGACLAPAVVGALLPEAYAAIGNGIVRPDPAVAPAAIFLLESAATFSLVLVLFFMTADHRRAQRTCLVKVGYLFTTTAALADVTGASFNPARAVGPAILSGETNGLLVYLLAPLVGAVAGALVARRFGVRPVHHRFGRPHGLPHYTLHWLRLVGVDPVAPSRPTAG